MDYKKLIRKKENRFRILRYLRIVPDSLMVKLQYRVKMKRKLNLKNPKRFTEKLQWYKVNYRNSLLTKCADKYKVREYIESKGLKDILVDLYAVYDDPETINIEGLPEKFVIKTTNGSGTNVLCKKKSSVDLDKVKHDLCIWLKRDNFAVGREWSYKGIKPRIIIEEYLEDNDNNFDGLNDYKFMCFNGKIACVFVYTDRLSPTGMKSGIYSREFQPIPYKRTGLNEINTLLEPPPGYEYMIKIAETLSEDFPHVRVDLYNVNGKIFFGELTFYHASGYVEFEPDEFDFILGEKFELPSILK